ncbi:SDR family oxidoreductase [Kineosporia sp. NBRC 101731]|uniref:SDR family oxidoreductase n=1 Tax=Kineosporia sp. NBRC 101731 TaxID=3032199 RepID=UPI0024A2587E|nr:SDR family oxidoreductase [Kineosporia sp. NBRC 101731]GLY30476.1 NmrA family transcriptional regulator [Kineosporia sp. NBRC 101731]
MIIVTGATGALNGSTVDHLLDRVPAQEIAVVARDVTKAQRFAERGVAVRPGDYHEPDSLPAAFEGADQLLLVSSSDPASPAVPAHRAAIEAAVRVGVGRILYTSHQGAAPDSPFAPARDHFATEQILADSGVAWTSLRNGFYAHSLAWLLGQWQETGRITVPGDGPVSWTSREDEGEAAAVILTSGTAYDGPTTITASAAPTFEEIAMIASELTGRAIACEVIDPEAWVAARTAGGQPEFMVRFLLGMYQAAQQGFFAGTDPLLKTLIGREPATVRDALAGLMA